VTGDFAEIAEARRPICDIIVKQFRMSREGWSRKMAKMTGECRALTPISAGVLAASQAFGAMR